MSRSFPLYNHYQRYPTQQPASMPLPPGLQSTPSAFGGTEGHYAMTQSAFGYNSVNIPGLNVNASFTGGNAQASSTRTDWNQQRPNSDRNKSRRKHKATPSSAAAHLPHSGPADSVAKQTRTSNTPTHLQTSQSMRAANHDELEEGELSESQFEDLYGRQSRILRKGSSLPGARNSQDKTPGSDLALTAVPTQQTAPRSSGYAELYADDQAPGKASQDTATKQREKIKNASSAAVRDRSGSYSPHLSPREIRGDDTDAAATAAQDNGPREAPNKGTAQPAKEMASTCITSLPAAPTTHIISSTLVASSQEPPSQSTMDTNSTEDSQPIRFSSLAEAKNEAKKAILKLLPLGVKFCTYVNEGFDQDLVKSLFQEINLDIDIPSPASAQSSNPPSSNSNPQAPQRDESFEISGVSTNNQEPSQQPSSQATRQTELSQSQGNSTFIIASCIDKKGEERKDRIARLLASRASKPMPPNTTAVSTVSEEVSPEIPAPQMAIKPRDRSEKDYILKQKMEALKRAQVASAELSSSATVSKGQSIGNSVIPASRPLSQTTLALAPLLPLRVAAVATSSNQSVVASSFPQKTTGEVNSTAIPADAIARATLSSNKAQLKRPVPPDVVEYAPGPVKAPFGQPRKYPSLVIDVSDASDDDEDVEMEVEDDDDTSSKKAAISGTASRDAPAVLASHTGKFSPLQAASKKDRDLALKEKAILELKRQIAAAEAKAKARKSEGSITPQKAVGALPLAGSGLPQLLTQQVRAGSAVATSATAPSATLASPEGPSAQLLSEAQSQMPSPPTEVVVPPESLTRSQRKNRCKATHLTASLKKKKARMQRLMDDQKRLQTEIDLELAEKEKLDQLHARFLDKHRAQAAKVVEDMKSPAVAHGEHTNGPNLDQPTHQVVSNGVCVEVPHSGDVEHKDDSRQQHTIDPITPMDVDGNDAAHAQAPAVSDHPSASEVSQLAQGVRSLQMDTESSRARSQPASPQNGSSSDSFLPDRDLTQLTSENAADLDVEPAVVDGANEADDGASDLYEPREDPAEINDIGNPLAPSPNVLSRAASTAAETPSQSRGLNAPSQSSHESQIEGEAAAEASAMPSQISNPRVHGNEVCTPQVLEAGQQLQRETAVETNPPPSFVPYESLLRYFRSYRFHPQYKNEVAGGWRSLTFSHRIDHNQAVCPHELDGRGCPDGDHCAFQHFANMAIGDKQFLHDLIADHHFSGEAKTRFVSGLRELLLPFQTNRVTDNNQIAQAIIEYRRRFLGDDSKILPLDGVTV